MKLYDKIVNPILLVRRLNVTACNIVNEEYKESKPIIEQIDLFTNYEEVSKQKEKSLKDEIRTEPNIITIPTNYACEFSIYIKPLCTNTINDNIKITGLDIKKGIIKEMNIKISFKTELSNYIDYDEIKLNKILGEGSFGSIIVKYLNFSFHLLNFSFHFLP